MRCLSRFRMLTAVFLFFSATANAQTISDDSIVTTNALVIGFLILSIILIVILGLMLLAKVNEFKSVLRKSQDDGIAIDNRNKVMNLNEDEVQYILQKRNKHGVQVNVPGTDSVN